MAAPAGLASPTPKQSEEFARTNGRLTVHHYLPRTSHDGTGAARKCEWSSHEAFGLSREETGALAWILVDTIMKARFGPATGLYTTWRDQTLAGTKIPSALVHTIASFVEPVFGLPHGPKNIHHVHGHIGEWLWHLLTKDNPAVRIQPDPKGDVTDAGGDGFSIYEVDAGVLRFRLWESKKYTGSRSPSSSINKAYIQLAKDGQRYVAKIVGAITPSLPDSTDEIVKFIAEVPEAWARGDGFVGAGVTLATQRPIPKKPFKRMATKFPLFDKPGQLRGLATSVSNYEELAQTVRRYAWTAL